MTKAKEKKTNARRILILGGYGYAGRCLAKHLLAETNVELIIGGRHLEKADAFAAKLGPLGGDTRVSTVRVDASDPDSLLDALRGGIDLLLIASGTAHHAGAVAHAALEAGVDYLDIQLSAQKIEALKRLAPKIESAGLCFVTEAGSMPGLPSALVRYAAAKLDTVERADVAEFFSAGSDSPYSQGFEDLAELFKDLKCQTFKNGEWTKPSQSQTKKFDFGTTIGEQTCTSLFIEEIRNLPDMHSSLKETGYYLAGTNWFVDLFIAPIVMIGMKIAPNRGVKPLGKLLWWGMKTSHQPIVDSLQLEADGKKGGEDSQLRVRMEHEDGFDLTAMAVVAYLKQYLDGSACRPGLHIMGQVAEPVRLLHDMEKMGARLVLD